MPCAARLFLGAAAFSARAVSLGLHQAVESGGNEHLRSARSVAAAAQRAELEGELESLQKESSWHTATAWVDEDDHVAASPDARKTGTERRGPMDWEKLFVTASKPGIWDDSLLEVVEGFLKETTSRDGTYPLTTSDAGMKSFAKLACVSLNTAHKMGSWKGPGIYCARFEGLLSRFLHEKGANLAWTPGMDHQAAENHFKKFAACLAAIALRTRLPPKRDMVKEFSTLETLFEGAVVGNAELAEAITRFNEGMKGYALKLATIPERERVPSSRLAVTVLQTDAFKNWDPINDLLHLMVVGMEKACAPGGILAALGVSRDEIIELSLASKMMEGQLVQLEKLFSDPYTKAVNDPPSVDSSPVAVDMRLDALHTLIKGTVEKMDQIARIYARVVEMYTKSLRDVTLTLAVEANTTRAQSLIAEMPLSSLGLEGATHDQIRQALVGARGDNTTVVGMIDGALRALLGRGRVVAGLPSRPLATIAVEDEPFKAISSSEAADLGERSFMLLTHIRYLIHQGKANAWDLIEGTGDVLQQFHAATSAYTSQFDA